MQIIDKAIQKADLAKIATASFGNLVKAVVDIEKKIMVIDASLHADEEAKLLSLGSKQSNLWGINFYPELDGDDFVEFDSMINLRPGQGNMTRGVDDPEIRSKILSVTSSLIK